MITAATFALAAALAISTAPPWIAGRGLTVEVEGAPAGNARVVLLDVRSGEVLAEGHTSSLSAKVRLDTPQWLEEAVLRLYLGSRQTEAELHLRFKPTTDRCLPGARCDLTAAPLARANLRGADLRGQDLSRADLRGADLRDALLMDADLTATMLTGANLEGANLSNARLQGADLEAASLIVAELEGADLRDTNLRFADLSDANLANADLLSARLGEATLTGAAFDNARCPDGTRAQPTCRTLR